MMVRKMTQWEAKMQLSTLCEGLLSLPPEADREITGLTLDSRQVATGHVFCACVGLHADGREFIPQAIANGAVAVLCEAGPEVPSIADVVSRAGVRIPIIAVADLAARVGLLADRFYGHPSHHMQMIGITGTNGKTSICHLLAHALQQLNRRCGVIGTVGTGFIDQLQSSLFTTPDSVATHKTLASLYQQGAEAVAMEASSHGLVQGRVNGVAFDIAGFTNLTHEHLDYHGSMQAYGNAKRLLFQQPGLQYGVINVDDAFGKALFNEFQNKLSLYAVSLKTPAAGSSSCNVFAHNIELTPQGLKAQVVTPWGEGELSSRLLGRFNLTNLLIVLSCLAIMEVPLARILTTLAQLPGIRGRMETFGGGEQPLVVVDFAHSPDALANALETLAAYKQQRLICVFGCGGDRDKSKRPVMAQVARQYSDIVIVTSDNPRHEAPEQIARDIEQGLTGVEYFVELDRKNAIASAIAMAEPGDVVLIAGKGHEMYQQVGDQRLPFSDQLELEKLLKQ